MSRIKHVSRGWTQDLYSWPLDLGLWKWWERKEILTWESQTSGVPFAPNSPPFILFMPPNNSSQSLVLIIYRISPTCTLINMRRDLKHAYITTCKNSTTTGSKSLSSPLLSSPSCYSADFTPLHVPRKISQPTRLTSVPAWAIRYDAPRGRNLWFLGELHWQSSSFPIRPWQFVQHCVRAWYSEFPDPRSPLFHRL